MKTKTIAKALFILFAITLPGLLQAKTPDVSETRTVGSFKAIKVSAGIDLILETGDRERVEVTGNRDDVDDIITEVKNETLHIYRKSKFGFNFNFHHNCEVNVTAKILEALSASSGSDVECRGTFKSPSFRVDASSGSEVSLSLDCEKVSADCSSGSEISLSGKTKTLSVSVSSGSEIHACDMSAEIVHADASSGGEACVMVTSELHANASSGGDIEYRGHPGKVDAHKSSGGSVSGS
jgi:hypothetical protein